MHKNEFNFKIVILSHEIIHALQNANIVNMCPDSTQTWQPLFKT